MLGWPHPDYLLECLTGEQLVGWYDYAEREPFGFPIDDTRGAMIMMTTANSAGAKTNTEDFTLGDKLRDASNDGLFSEGELIEKIRSLFPQPPTQKEGPPPKGE